MAESIDCNMTQLTCPARLTPVNFSIDYYPAAYTGTQSNHNEIFYLSTRAVYQFTDCRRVSVIFDKNITLKFFFYNGTDANRSPSGKIWRILYRSVYYSYRTRSPYPDPRNFNFIPGYLMNPIFNLS